MLSLMATLLAITSPPSPYSISSSIPTWLGMLQVYQTHQDGQVVMVEPMTSSCIPPHYLCLDIQHKNMTDVKIQGA
jgi:hypothetical protein